MTKIQGLRRVGLGVRELPATEQFYRSCWGMTPDGEDEGRRYFRSRGLDHSDLVLVQTPENGLHHVGLAVASDSVLDALAQRLKAAGHAVSALPAAELREDESRGAVVHDLDGNRIELIVPHTPAGAQGAATSAQGAARPRHLGHIVLWSGQTPKQEAFYALLGFQVSDRTHIGMSFLRVNRDHHSIALARSVNGHTGLQHAAFDVGSVDDVMREYARLRDSGERCIWGVGRHGPGNNVFAYYKDPAGHIVEYYGDMEESPEGEIAEPRFWGPEHKGDIWGVAGMPPMQFRD
jgi:catechol-2,3-dioxygenase